jgi:2-methylcitrate dehydratase PrpD
MSWTTRTLAEYVTSVTSDSLSPEVVRGVKDVILDLIGCAASGQSTAAARTARSVAMTLFAGGSSQLWFAAAKRRPEAAVMANSTAASALDLDDGHRLAGGHPGAAIVPAVLAIGPAEGSGGTNLLAATALGYEVAVRIAAARDVQRLDTFATGRWCAYGVAAAAGKLLSVSEATLAQALAIAGVLSPGLSASGYSRLMGNQVKEGIPWAAATGLTALELARNGYTGPLDILDHPDYFDAREITGGLGQSFAVTSVYFKLYACCRWLHAAIDAMVEIVRDEDLPLESISVVEVHTFERVRRLPNDLEPDCLESAQYSLPFCLGVAAAGGPDALCPLSSGWLRHPQALALAKKVRILTDPELDRCFPAEAGARVVVESASKRHQRAHRFALGDPGRPMNRAQIEAKFRRLARGSLSPEDQGALFTAVEGLEALDRADVFDTILGKIP